MLLPADQRRLLGAFLRARREALTPAVAGLPVPGRRRTPGLRREEVAQLSGLSTAWYSWAEQGRDIALSEAALARLARALQLSPAERAYLFDLTRRRDPAPSPVLTGPSQAPADLAAALEGITAPAYVLDPLWQVCGRNAAAERLFALWFGSGEPNLLRFVFLDPAARAFIDGWEERARRVAAEFRADTAHDTENPALAALVEGLLAGSPAFARFWTDHAVLAREGGSRRFQHPADGALAFTQITLHPATHPGYKLVMLVPDGPLQVSR